MKSSSHGRFTSAISLSFLFTLSFFLIVTLTVPAAIKLAPAKGLIKKIVARSQASVDSEKPKHHVTALPAAPAIVDPGPLPLPYVQDFSALPHSASTYPPGWTGAQIGAGTSAGSAANFKTIEPTADLGLTANGTASSSAGAVHNFNGKIGFLSTGSADPSIVLAIDTTGQADVNIAFDVMTIRNPYNGTTNTRIGEVDLQYRICSSSPCSGAFASASASPGVYRNNMTSQTTGTTPQNPEAKTITLPAAADNQANVQLRFVQRDVSGTGARASFAVDNIAIAGSEPCASPVITLEPLDQSVTYGVSTISFASMATGEPAPGVYWEVDAGSGFVALANGAGVSGADTTVLTISAPDVAMNGNVYRAVFSNGCGSDVTSTAAALSVAPLAITVTPESGQSKIYGDPDPALNYTHAPSLAFSDSFSGELGRDAGEATGNYTINQGTLVFSSNYDLVFTAHVPFVINPKLLTAAIAAEDKVYDGTTAAFITCSLTGSIAPDVVSCSAGAAAFASDDVGTHTVTVSGLTIDGADAGNYALPVTTATGAADIFSRVIDVTAVASSKEYDGNILSNVTPTVSSPGIVVGDTATFNQAFADRNAGTGKVLIPSGTVDDGNGGNNYAINFINNTTGVILQKPVIVTAVAATKALDGNTSSAGIPSVTPPPVSGDAPNFIQTYDTPSAGTGKTLTPSGEMFDGFGGSNYAYTFVSVNTGVITTSYCFNGFHSPIGGAVENGNGGTLANPARAFKLNSTIPIKFTLYEGECGESPVTSGVHTLLLVKYTNAVDSEPAIDATPTGNATTGNQFRLEGTDWHFNLDTRTTPGITAGTWLLKATLSDGSVKTVWISIKR